MTSRFRTLLDLYSAGEEMMRLKLAREHPDLTASELEAALVRWLRQRPGAETGDCPGPPRAQA